MKIEDYFVAQFHTVFFLQADKKNHWTEKLGETTQSSPVLLTLPWIFEFFCCFTTSNSEKSRHAMG